MSLFLILLAAGDSKRFKSNTPKIYHKINNKTLLEHSFNAFKNLINTKRTIITYNKKHKKYLNNINLDKSIKIIGGSTRQDSTFKALKYIKKMNCKKVLIHDAARPNIPEKTIKEIITKLKNNHAVIPVLKVNDATKRMDRNVIFKNIKRDSLVLSQTPQGFTFSKIFEKHKENINGSFDDDSSLFTLNGDKVLATRGSKLYLGGVKIPFYMGLEGHSDADPVFHSLIDSLLGACGLGDIGKLFPDKNKKYQNIRSTILLKKVIKLIKSKNFSINNIDINIIAQKPKIKKYSNKMINVISRFCEIDSHQINIKGKTTEKLGLIGKEKAIASEVISSVTKYD